MRQPVSISINSMKSVRNANKLTNEFYTNTGFFYALPTWFKLASVNEYAWPRHTGPE